MRLKIMLSLLVIILVSFVYSDLTEIGFANVDDQWMLLDETLIQTTTFDWALIKNVMLRVNSLQYSPLNTFYYYLIYQINGYDPYWYHLFSYLIHLLNTILVFVVTRQVLRKFNISNPNTQAYIVTLVWAILPFNVESVVWISASKVLLFTFWGLLSFIFFVEAYTRINKWLYLFSILFFILSFLSKEQSVLFALMMALFILVYERQSSTNINWKGISLFVSPFFLLALVFGIITLYVAIYGGGSHDFPRYPFYQRIILAFYCVCFYVFNLFVPVHLQYHYPFPMVHGSSLPYVYYIYPVLLLTIMRQAFVLIKERQNQWLYIFCFGVFIIHLILSIQVFPLARAAIVADRYMYVPSIGLLLLAAVCINEYVTKIVHYKAQAWSKILIGSIMIYVIILSLYSHVLVSNWKNMQL